MKTAVPDSSKLKVGRFGCYMTPSCQYAVCLVDDHYFLYERGRCILRDQSSVQACQDYIDEVNP